jgi:ABC-type sugar transport system ATPase subunit
MRNITKEFPGVRALSKVNLSLYKGEVLGVVGENGAGKSTLMNIMLGSLEPEEGEMTFHGKPFHPKNPSEALHAGIAMIHQELTLVPEMSVSENIWLGQEEKFRKGLILQINDRDKATEKLLKSLGIEVPIRKKVKALSVAEMQLVEIARAVSYDSEVIIMDEPTSSLTRREIDLLYKIIESLKSKGVSITFITHKLDEVYATCHDVMIMRDGHVIDTKPIGEITRNEMIEKMVGREVTNLYPKEFAEIGDVLLEVKGLTRKGYFEDISFQVRRGEILGFAGLVKAGRSEVMECIFGIEKPTAGEIFMDGNKLKIKSTRDAIDNGMAMITEDRLRRGLIHIHSLRSNLSLAYLPSITRGGFVRRKVENEDCERVMKQTKIKATGLNQLAGQLSGGNQQKVIIAKWLLTKAELFIFDEPTRGIDVGSKAEIYKLMCALAKEGKAIIMISSELPEVMAMSDRMIIMAAGKEIAELNCTEFDDNKIMRCCFGYSLTQAAE